MLRQLAAVAALVLLFSAGTAPAQIVGDSVGANIQAPWNSASGGVQSLRSPGQLVTRGRVTYRAAHGDMIVRSRFGPEITEQAPATTVDQDVRVEVINTLFDNFNLALQAWLASIRLNAGLSPTTGSGGLSDLLGSITSPI